MLTRRAFCFLSAFLFCFLTSAVPLLAAEADSLRLDPNVAPTFEGITLQVDADQ
ncbi:MAG: hypothetical protein HY710_13245, partial [Candidatus Latescibacteria bacterium]|nr:hypothetical protein [Candidatus Latescibacterota bacterium]